MDVVPDPNGKFVYISTGEELVFRENKKEIYNSIKKNNIEINEFYPISHIYKIYYSKTDDLINYHVFL